MNTEMDYLCPICNEGHIKIKTERTEEIGCRFTDITIVNKSCDCITYECESIAQAIRSYKNIEEIKNNTCANCKVENACVKYQVRFMEYNYLCANCLKEEMKKLEEKYKR